MISIRNTKQFMVLVGASVAAAVLMLGSCAGSGAGSGDDGEVVFLDRTLQGNFNGKSYTFVSGYATESYSTAGAYDLRLYNLAPEGGVDPWAFGAYPSSGYLEVMATVPATVGRTDLYWDLNTGENETVTLYDPDNGTTSISSRRSARWRSRPSTLRPGPLRGG
jgi:hypothetical protein